MSDCSKHAFDVPERMTETEKLRTKLDERGIAWKGSGNKTWWGQPIDLRTGEPIGVYHNQAEPMGDERLFLQVQLARAEQAIAATLGTEINGETSDGYHTFNELYHHRAVLFSVVVANHRNIAWKAKKHHDGTMYDGMFIVGLDTPWGQASYHYDIDPYWDMFNCEERESAPEWDGHTPDEAIERIGKLATLGNTIAERTCRNVCKEWEKTSFAHAGTSFCCSECGAHYVDCECYYAALVDADEEQIRTNYCPNCGRKVVDA